MRRYLGLVLALVVLAGGIYFVWNENRKDRLEGKKQDFSVVFPFGAASVQQLSVTLDGKEAKFRHAGAGWEVVSGPDGADPSVATDFIGVWSRVRLLQVVDEAPRDEDLARYGLKTPLVKASVVVAPDAAQQTGIERPAIELGADGKLGPSAYARLDGFPRVVLISMDARDLEKGVGRRLFGLESQAPPEPDHQSGPMMQRIPGR